MWWDGTSPVAGPGPATVAPASVQRSERVENHPAEGGGAGTAVPGEDLGRAAAGAGPADSPARPFGWRPGGREG